MSLITLAVLFFVSFIFTVLATGVLLPILRRGGLLDEPNERSSHTTPTLYGGGIAVTLVVIILFVLLAVNPFDWFASAIDFASFWMILAVVGLALVSWLDDIKGVPQIFRLIIHFAAVFILLLIEPGKGLVFQGVAPLWLDRFVSAILWVWFINLFNFMDGIDGITGVETASISIGIVLLAGALGWKQIGQAHALILAGAGIGFLWWNWHPAKVFLGDVGSIPLGYLLGWLLLSLAAEGHWMQALILPLYYLVDATFTLFIRLCRGEKLWEAHRDHYYQQAVQKGLSHAKVANSIAIANVFLIGFAVSSLRAPVTGLVGAAVVIVILLVYFRKKPNT